MTAIGDPPQTVAPRHRQRQGRDGQHADLIADREYQAFFGAAGPYHPGHVNRRLA